VKAHQRITELNDRMIRAFLSGRFITGFGLLRLRHDFREFAQTLAKQRAIQDGYDLILEPDAWLPYVFEITKEDYEDYLHAKIHAKHQS